MSKERYSSKTQEFFYRPWRVQVGAHNKTSGLGSSGYITYWSTYKVDMVTHEAVHLTDKPTKGEAVSYAKAVAETRDLAFDLQRDIFDDDKDIVQGPIVTCEVCQKAKNRTHDPIWVCKACEQKIEMIRQNDEQRKTVALHPALAPGWVFFGPHSRHISYPIGSTIDERLRSALQALSGNSAGRHFSWDEKVSQIVTRTQPRLSTGYNLIYLTDSQIEALVWIVGSPDQPGLLDELAEAVYAQGHKDGSNLLGQLASGDVNATTWAIEREQTALERKQKEREREENRRQK